MDKVAISYLADIISGISRRRAVKKGYLLASKELERFKALGTTYDKIEFQASLFERAIKIGSEEKDLKNKTVLLANVLEILGKMIEHPENYFSKRETAGF